MRGVVILGSTGKIGVQTLEVLESFKEDFKVIGLAAGTDEEMLKEQASRFGVEHLALGNPDAVPKDSSIGVGEKALVNLATLKDADIIINAVVGKAGLIPTLEALRKGKLVGLANKETLVLAGHHVMKIAMENKGSIIPIDSEHSALFQSLHSGRIPEVKRLILTMGKGPIAEMDEDQLRKVTMKDVLDRPKWDMGTKINVDSATCMNKAFEVIEAGVLFGVPPEMIDIIVHPEYLCHSLVEFNDGSIITEIGSADMKRYIQYALNYPERKRTTSNHIDLIGKSLSFEAPPHSKFPCLSMGHLALKKRGTMPAVIHGADTSAVKAFIQGKISFTEIPKIIAQTIAKHELKADPSITEILEAESWAEKHAWTLGGQS